jgi:hypothetical protein
MRFVLLLSLLAALLVGCGEQKTEVPKTEADRAAELLHTIQDDADLASYTYAVVSLDVQCRERPGQIADLAAGVLIAFEEAERDEPNLRQMLRDVDQSIPADVEDERANCSDLFTLWAAMRL